MKGSRKFDDSELSDLIRNGGKELEAAFKYLKREEQRAQNIKNMVIRTGGTKEDFEEVFNDALINLYSSILKGNFRGESSIIAYLMGIARNLWNKKRTKRKHGLYDFSQFSEREPSIEIKIIKGERRQLLLEY